MTLGMTARGRQERRRNGIAAVGWAGPRSEARTPNPPSLFFYPPLRVTPDLCPIYLWFNVFSQKSGDPTTDGEDDADGARTETRGSDAESLRGLAVVDCFRCEVEKDVPLLHGRCPDDELF